MHRHLGTRWQQHETELEELRYPDVAFLSGATEGDLSLLIVGPTEAGETRYYVLTFYGVQIVESYAELFYSVLGEVDSGPGCAFSTITNSQLLPRIEERLGGGFAHFVVCGGNMCSEVVADEHFVLRRFASEQEARATTVRELVA